MSMVWAKLDDGFTTNPKVALLSDRAFRLYVHGLVYSAQNLTDGRVDAALLHIVMPGVGKPSLARAVGELVDRRLWIQEGDWFQIKDFADYQPTKSQVEAQRSRWREYKRNVRGGLPEESPESLAAPSRPVPNMQQQHTEPVENPPESTEFSLFNDLRATEVATRKRANNPRAYAFMLRQQPDFLAESKRIFGHRDCPACKGSGFTEVYGPGSGTVKVECKEET